MSRLSPVEVDCPVCDGIGRSSFDPWQLCVSCNGIGKAFLPGGPEFGCKKTLAKCKPGMLVTLGGTGDRGRVMQQTKQGYTYLAMESFSGEDKVWTPYPNIVGVSSVADPRWFGDSDAHAQEREDAVDPLRKAAP